MRNFLLDLRDFTPVALTYAFLIFGCLSLLHVAHIWKF